MDHGVCILAVLSNNGHYVQKYIVQLYKLCLHAKL